MLSLKLLGDAAIEADHGRVTGRCAQRHQIALLALLASAPHRTLSRDKLIGLLWPESDTKHARNLLNVSVYAIRKALGEDALQSAGDGIQLAAARWHVDVVDFETAVAARDLERAASIYAGPFLDGFFLGDAPDFNRWQETERDRLARRYASALQALATDAETRGDSSSAADWWRRLAAHDPYDSSAALGLMRALERTGNRAAAVQHAKAHGALLRDELGVEPTADVTGFAATLARDRLTPPPVATARSHVDVATADGPASPDLARSDRFAENDPEPSQLVTGGGLSDRSAPASLSQRVSRVAARAALIALPLALVGYVAVSVDRVGDATRVEMQPTDGDLAAAVGSTRSVAILPFVNVGGDTANEYFADGLTDELTTRLQKVRGLRVVSRRSAFAFKDSTGVDARQIGRRLGVGTVVEGTMHHGAGRVRVTAQITSARDGSALWSATYERDRREIFTIQNEIVRAVAGTLGLAVSSDATALMPGETNSFEAHALYLRAHFLVNNARGERDLRESIAFYEHALAVDPTYAPAWAGIADAWAWLADWYVRPNEAYPQAKTAALNALAIDSTLAEAHAVLGAVQAAYDWDFAAAERSARRAMALGPNSANALVYATWPLLASGALDSAVSAIRRARTLDPLSASTGFTACWALTAAGRYDEATGEARKMLALNAQEPLASWAMGVVLSAQGRHAEALPYLQRAASMGLMPRADYARTLAALGRRDEALRLVRELKREGQRRYVSPPSIAVVYVHLGDHDAAFRWLERGYRLRSAELTSLRYRRAWDPVRNDPRFQAIVRRVWGAA
jgi:TolB-like protein/DNA-binding SARP family transcriptional activator